MLIGLGVAVDYSLLIVYRYREELRASTARQTRPSRGRWPPPGGLSYSAYGGSIIPRGLVRVPLPFMRGFGFGLFIPVVPLCAR